MKFQVHRPTRAEIVVMLKVRLDSLTPEALERVASDGERIVIAAEGEDKAVLISLEDYHLLQEIEDRLDVEAFREAKKQAGAEGMVPWEEARSQLGL
jgi:prevent-host-death family protein